ncbi:MAG: pyridoxal-dependent decarboxylase, partial [bacterium]|nr:pyridoxal-dependent decarboxylase [bacterium]
TIGTTFKGAIDSVDGIQKVLQGYPSYVHVDAALFGGYLPVTEHAAEVQLRNAPSQQPRYDSIAISCHKFFGFPSPAGLYLTRSEVYDQFNELFRQIHNPEYIHQVPGTITCSRDSVKPAEFRYFATEPARLRQKSDAVNMLDNTAYLMRQMQSRFPELQARRSNPLSNTVYFSYPGDAIVNKYSLATMHLAERGDRKRFAHVVVMPHVSRNVLDGLLEDLGKAPSPRE